MREVWAPPRVLSCSCVLPPLTTCGHVVKQCRQAVSISFTSAKQVPREQRRLQVEEKRGNGLLHQPVEALPELWDVSSNIYKDRNWRAVSTAALASEFATDTKEISRKLHNLRTQLNSELRRMRKRKSGGRRLQKWMAIFGPPNILGPVLL
uniref:MADF domain-containing protein n=1 Tax=Lygus hesperus TaxID=30085 RepID=A0A146KWA1_LYGHE